MLEMLHDMPQPSRSMLCCLTKLWPKPVRSKTEISFILKALNDVLCSSFNAEISSSSDRMAATAPSMFISLAAAIIYKAAVTSALWSSSVVFNGSLLESLLAFNLNLSRNSHFPLMVFADWPYTTDWLKSP